MVERDVGRHLEFPGAVPAGLIENENGVGAGGDLGRDLVEMKLHGFAVANWQHEGGAGSAVRANCAEQVGRQGTLIVNGAGTRALASPAVGPLVLLPDPHLVLEPHLYRRAWRKLRADFRHA